MTRRFTVFAVVFAVSLLLGIQAVEVVEANFIGPYLPNIYIRTDGSIDPPTVPITKVGNQYYLTDKITNYQIIIQCDNIVLDGRGFTLQGRGDSYPDTAITFEYNLTYHKAEPGSGRQNIVITNLTVTEFNTGIDAFMSSKCMITSNNFKCNYGVLLYGCVNDIVNHNTFSGNGKCISIDGSSNNITGNSFSNFNIGIDVAFGQNNIVMNNSFSDVSASIQIYKATNTTFNGKIMNPGESVPIPPTTPTPTLEPTYVRSNYLSYQALFTAFGIMTAILVVVLVPLVYFRRRKGKP
jgi:parallel beta-helix repeat protein